MAETRDQNLETTGAEERSTIKSEIHQSTEHYLVFGRFYLVPTRNTLIEQATSFKYFSIAGVLSYHAFYDDFGPMSLRNISLFCSILDEQLKQYQDRPIALKSHPDRRTMANSVFLIGSYMILRLGMDPDEVADRLGGVMPRLAAFRDILPGRQNFDLHVRDCWGGLWRAKSLRWVEDEKGIDPYEHDFYGSAMHGALHEIVPGKFIGMRGPQDLPDGEALRDVCDEDGRIVAREFSPGYYISIFRRFGVQVILAHVLALQTHGPGSRQSPRRRAKGPDSSSGVPSSGPRPAAATATAAMRRAAAPPGSWRRPTRRPHSPPVARSKNRPAPHAIPSRRRSGWGRVPSESLPTRLG